MKKLIKNKKKQKQTKCISLFTVNYTVKKKKSKVTRLTRQTWDLCHESLITK
jgi:hypothetical protein